MNFQEISTKEDLLSFVQQNEPRPILAELCEWILTQEGHCFYAPRQGIPVREMIRNWSLRLERMELNGTVAAGLRELLDRLELRSLDERVFASSYEGAEFPLCVVADSEGGYLGFNRLVPSHGVLPAEFKRLERQATCANNKCAK